VTARGVHATVVSRPLDNGAPGVAIDVVVDDLPPRQLLEMTIPAARELVDALRVAIDEAEADRRPVGVA
jgi:hypothetical protein